MDNERTGPLAHQPGPPSTGDSRVDEAIARLAVLGEVPLDEHPPVLEAVHDRLREILGELGSASPGAASPGAASPGAASPGPGAPRPSRPAPDGQWRQGQLGAGQDR